jgi:hypothetical protein
MPATLDVAGPAGPPRIDRRFRYAESPRTPIAYYGRAPSRHLATSRRRNLIVVRDATSGAEGVGTNYLAALRALGAPRS